MTEGAKSCGKAGAAPNFCGHCGGRLGRKWIEAERRDRLVCLSCDAIHYRNPKVLVAGIITCGQRLLLCRRAQEPSSGLWTPPAGFMEENETLEEAASREVLEETGVTVDPDSLILHTISSLPSISEVYVTFRGSVESTAAESGPECLEVGFFREEEIPWHALAYQAMAGFLKMFFREMTDGRFGVHLGHVDQSGKSRRSFELLAIGAKHYSVGALPRNWPK
jgi:ADP-ribose pyrophosphatase YjhB (NUDIX family)